jgi:hypothetical protein
LVEDGSLVGLREEVKPDFISFVSSFIVKVIGVFHYYIGFPDVVYESCSVRVGAVLTCRQFYTMHWLVKYLSLSP